jgi:hypothetical protein
MEIEILKQSNSPKTTFGEKIKHKKFRLDVKITSMMRKIASSNFPPTHFSSTNIVTIISLFKIFAEQNKDQLIIDYFFHFNFLSIEHDFRDIIEVILISKKRSVAEEIYNRVKKVYPEKKFRLSYYTGTEITKINISDLKWFLSIIDSVDETYIYSHFESIAIEDKDFEKALLYRKKFPNIITNEYLDSLLEIAFFPITRGRNDRQFLVIGDFPENVKFLAKIKNDG